MSPTARFRVDPKLAALLGEGYRSSEYALKELIDNAWDADATRVDVVLPEPMTGGPIRIEDDGTGMTEHEVRRDYLAVASDRSSRKGERTVERNRSVKGRKGIGKFAGLMAADTMTVETRCRGVLTRLVIRKQELHPGVGDLEAIDLPVETNACEPSLRGTTVTLTSLSQAFDPPSSERLRPILMLEYGRQEDFTVVVNGEQIGVEDIPGETFEHTEELDPIGRVRLRFTISDGKKALRQSGVAVRVTGKVVGKPMTFGLENDEEIPPKLLKKLYGELEADGLASDVTADWGAVIENSTAFNFVSGWAASHLKRALSTVFANEMQLARARLTQQIQRRLAQLPEHRRPFAEQKIERLLTNLYGEREERVETVVSVALDAIEEDHYFTVVKAVDDARSEDIVTFARALGEFGLVDMAVMGDQARRRLDFLEQLDALVSNPATREAEMHTALERNLWVLGAEFSLLASNKTLKRVIEDYTGAKYTGIRAAERPDLLLISGVTGRHALIEFKRPSLDITREHEAQAAAYRDDLVTSFPGLDVVLIGRAWAQRSDRSFVPHGLTVTSYNAIVSRARAELSWLLEQVTADSPSLQRPHLALQVG
jgi:hypothetical protein